MKIWRFVNVNVNVNVNDCEDVNFLWNIGNEKKIKLWRFVNVNVNACEDIKFPMKHMKEQGWIYTLKFPSNVQSYILHLISSLK